VYYFAYGTTQHGFPHHREALGEPLGRFRLEGHAIVVPHEGACSNPGCSLLHRMAVLIPWDSHAEGDVFAVDDALLADLDALELSGPYVREAVTLDGLRAFAYPARDPGAWAALVRSGRADALTSYPLDLAVSVPKPCCSRRPGHPGPHDVLDPLGPLGDQRRGGG
jgi:gamma-glutamylcyclotransferase (GGCT)/AIG2-like uncharacterized protein YtfP